MFATTRRASTEQRQLPREAAPSRREGLEPPSPIVAPGEAGGVAFTPSHGHARERKAVAPHGDIVVAPKPSSGAASAALAPPVISPKDGDATLATAARETPSNAGDDDADGASREHKVSWEVGFPVRWDEATVDVWDAFDVDARELDELAEDAVMECERAKQVLRRAVNKLGAAQRRRNARDVAAVRDVVDAARLMESDLAAWVRELQDAGKRVVVLHTAKSAAFAARAHDEEVLRRHVEGLLAEVESATSVVKAVQARALAAAEVKAARLRADAAKSRDQVVKLVKQERAHRDDVARLLSGFPR